MLKAHRIIAANFIVLAALSATVRADSFFNLSVTGTNGTVVNASGATIIDLVNNVVTQQGQFAALQGQGTTTALEYGGVHNAVLLSVNSSQTTATLTFPTTGFTQTFTGTSNSDLQKQIESFIEKNQSSAYGNLIESLNQLSPVAAVDGNPHAATAAIADTAYDSFGLTPTAAAGNGQWRILADGGFDNASSLNGDYARFALEHDAHITNHIAFATDFFGQYQSVSGSEAGTAGVILGLPVTLFSSYGDDGFTWELTPWGFAALSASVDQIAGGILVGGGGTSRLSYRIGPVVLTVADQIDDCGHVDVTFDKYSFEVPVNQWILKNGGKVAWQPKGGGLFVDAGCSYSNFLHTAAVPNYWTPTAGVGFTWGNASSIRLAYLGEFGRGYRSEGGELQFTFAY
jgi:hypothetical protein